MMRMLFIAVAAAWLLVTIEAIAGILGYIQ